ncbi:MAG TPA: ABC transporter [Flavobacteriales bacterium]|nr:ABC transporter [Flavobacteriales bacterium]
MRELWKLNPYIAKYPHLLLGGMIFIFLTNLFAVYAPSLIGEGVNAMKTFDDAFLAPIRDGQTEAMLFAESPVPEFPFTLKRIQAWFGGDTTAWTTGLNGKEDALAWIQRLAIWQAGLFLLAYLVKGIFLFFTRQTIIVMSRRIEYDLKGTIFDQYQRLDATFYKAQDTGDLMNRISEDVSKVRMYLGPAIMYTLNLTMLIILVVIVMVYIDWKLTLYALSPLPLMSVGIYFVSSRINRQSEDVQRQQSGLSTFVQQHIAGIRVLKSFKRERDATKRFAKEADRYKMCALDLVKTEALFMPIIVLLVGLSTILTIYIGGQRVIAGELEVGHIFQFIFYVNLLTWPFASVGWVTSLVQKAEASMKRINDFMEVTPLIQSPLANNSAPVTMEELAFDNVSYRYPETGIEALQGISFSVKRGQIVAITGRTGSGKSTIAQLAMRIIDPCQGKVTLNGKSLTEWDLDALRGLTGYVPQDVFLFSDTIAGNIAFAMSGEEADLEAVKGAAEEAHVAHNIEGFERGYNTVLGERGINLSGGQKQRISIARAFLRKPHLLILDDCLSAVDTETEDVILKSIRKRGNEAAVLLISHRISSIRGADHVIVLDNGRVIESGTPSELVEAGGLYARMVEQQTESA